MDQSESERRKIELSHLLEARRHDVSAARDSFGRELSLSTQLKRSVREHPGAWFAGSFGSAALLGLLLSRSGKSSTKRRGPIGLLFGLGFALAKPALLKWGLERLKFEANQYLHQRGQNFKLGEPKQL
ncbi:MAG: hypothetical protein ACSHYF_00385 [Verrucomicrobiaceae bacterium]